MKTRSFLALVLLVMLASFAPLSAAQNDDLQTVLADYVASDDPGVVVLVSTEEEDYSAAAGLADLAQGTPITVADKFRIGSITKTFVAVIMLQLQSEGVLNLDDPIENWLPDDIVSQIPYGEQITLRQLLNMTSGIFNYTESDAFYEAVFANPTHPWTAEETVQYAFGEEAYFPPGEGYYYSNTNYNLLHMVIETATEQPLAEVLQARIFDPVGMTDSSLEPPTVAQDIVRGYTDFDGDGQLDDVTEVNEGNGLGDGGIICTAADLAAFGWALVEGELLTEEAMAEMQDYVDDGEGGQYGLGLSRWEGDYGEELGHTGATAGFQSALGYFPADGVMVVVLTNNFDSEIVGDVAYAALEALSE